MTEKGSDHFVRTEDRVAVFDNDGTLWTEQPIYSQIYFTLNRVKELAPQHPEWKNEQPFKAILENDFKTLSALSEPDAATLLAKTHAGMTEDEFESEVSKLNYSTASNSHRRLGLILHHDDPDREYKYDRESKVGHLEKALDAAAKQHWIVVSMKDDFKRVF